METKPELVLFLLRNVGRELPASNENVKEARSNLGELLAQLVPNYLESVAGHISAKSLTEMKILVSKYSDEQVLSFANRNDLKTTKPAFWKAIQMEKIRRGL